MKRMIEYYIDGSMKDNIVGAGFVKINEFGFIEKHHFNLGHINPSSNIAECYCLEKTFEMLKEKDIHKNGSKRDGFNASNEAGEPSLCFHSLLLKSSFSNLNTLTSFPVPCNRALIFQEGAKRNDRDSDGPYGTFRERQRSRSPAEVPLLASN